MSKEDEEGLEHVSNCSEPCGALEPLPARSLNLLRRGVDASYQSDSPDDYVKIDVSAQMDDSQVSLEECLLISRTIDKHLGYSDAPLSKAELMGQAQYLVKEKWGPHDLEAVISSHSVNLDRIRRGDSLQRLDGEVWKIQGFGGRIIRTASNTVEVLEYDAHAAIAKVRDNGILPRTRNGERVYGKVELANYVVSVHT